MDARLGEAVVNGEIQSPTDLLRQSQIQSSIGVGYQLAPLWGDAKPVQNKIAVVVRYTPVNGAPLTSAPSVIATR